MRRLRLLARPSFIAALTGMALFMVAASASPAGSQTIADIPDIAPVPAALAAADNEATLFLMVVVNGRDTGLLGEFFKSLENGRVSSTRSELKEIGIRTRGSAGARVALDSIEGLDYTLDEVRQVMAITAATSVLVPHRISARPLADLPEPQSGFGAVLNYRLTGNLGDNVLDDGFRLSSFFAALDGRIFAPLGVLTTTGFASSSGQAGSMQVRRQDTNFVYSAPQRMLTFTIGRCQQTVLVRGPEASSSPSASR